VLVVCILNNYLTLKEKFWSGVVLRLQKQPNNSTYKLLLLRIPAVPHPPLLRPWSAVVRCVRTGPKGSLLLADTLVGGDFEVRL
jgi:hypothetical protein